MQLNEKQSSVIQRAKLGRNLFITGAGGVGKSVVIRELQALFGNTSLLLAPTGIAALNIQGSTLHRVFGLPFSIATDDDSRHYSPICLDLFRDADTVKTIIIDEVSMVRADLLICIDNKLRHLKRKPDQAFGGVQVIVVGDFFQLCPVLTDRDSESFYDLYDSIYCFDTDTWDDLDFDVVQLTEVMRQEDLNTQRALSSIRHGQQSPAVLKWLNSMCARNTRNDDAIVLCTVNATAGNINGDRFDAHEGEEHRFIAKTTGTFRERPVDASISLKDGIRVIICANSAPNGYMNGQTGTVTGFTTNGAGDECIMVDLDSGSTVLVEKYTWENIEPCVVNGKLAKKVVGTFTQYPLKLGYAITIHKSQGMTLDDCHIDLGRGAFAHGQTYVGLSRIRSLEKLTLERSVRQSDIIVDAEVIEFHQYIKSIESAA